MLEVLWALRLLEAPGRLTPTIGRPTLLLWPLGQQPISLGQQIAIQHTQHPVSQELDPPCVVLVVQCGRMLLTSSYFTPASLNLDIFRSTSASFSACLPLVRSMKSWSPLLSKHLIACSNCKTASPAPPINPQRSVGDRASPKRCILIYSGQPASLPGLDCTA